MQRLQVGRDWLQQRPSSRHVAQASPKKTVGQKQIVFISDIVRTCHLHLHV